MRLNRDKNKEFGLTIRTGQSCRPTENGYRNEPAFFISRMSEGGIAYGTGLLAVDDEIIEVNGIEVSGKTLDQVTDMMVANMSYLVITVRPKDQGKALVSASNDPNAPRFHSGDTLRLSNTSSQFHQSDRIRDTSMRSPNSAANHNHYSSSLATAAQHSSPMEQEEEDEDEDIEGGLITL